MIDYKQPLGFGVSIRSASETRKHTQLNINWKSRYWSFKIPNIIKPVITSEVYSDGNNNLKIFNTIIPTEYGFCVHEECLWIYHGRNSHDSLTTDRYDLTIPWRQWNLTRVDFLYPTHASFFTMPYITSVTGRTQVDTSDIERIRLLVPTVKFYFTESNGNSNTVTCYIEEREWRLGKGWFKWVKYVTKPIVRKSINMTFERALQSGIIETGFDMLPGESILDTFKRFGDTININTLTHAD